MTTISQQIETERDAERVVCRLFHGNQVEDRKSCLRKLGFRDFPAELWIRLSAEQAKSLLTECLHKDLAYKLPGMPFERADKLAAAFLSALPPDCQFLTNGDPYGLGFTPRQGWEPISPGTFDTGILAERNGVVGICWVVDED